MQRIHVLLASVAILVGFTACGGSSRPHDPGSIGYHFDAPIIPQDVIYSDSSVTDADHDPGQLLPDPVSENSGISDTALPDAPAVDIKDMLLEDQTAQPEVQGGCEGCQTGTLTGLTCAPDGETAIPNVKVWIETQDCNGTTIKVETISNEKGEYTLENVPCGLQSIQMQKGSFKHQFAVFVNAGMVMDASSSDRCFATNAAKIAVVTGDWDRIELVLDQLKLEYDEYDGLEDFWGFGGAEEAIAFLTNSTKLNEYDVLFINCGPMPEEMMWSDGTKISANLSKFLEKGGSLYVSDYAFVFFEETWPGYVDFPSDPYQVFKETVDGHVVDPPLFAYLGKDYIPIEYSLTPLVTATDISPETLLHMEAYFDQFGETRPIMMSFSPYPDGGRVVFTNFHNEEGWGIQQDLAQILNYVVFLL